MLEGEIAEAEGVGAAAEKEREVEEELEEGVENNAALLNSKSNETKGKRVTTSIAGLLLALAAGIFGGEPSCQGLMLVQRTAIATYKISVRCQMGWVSAPGL